MKNSRQLGFTLPELLVVVAILGIGAYLLLPALARRSYPAHRIKCVSNLKNVGLSFRIYATDHNDLFPWQIRTSSSSVAISVAANPVQYIRAVTNELSTPKILICMSDTRAEATNWTTFTRWNLSYFISPNASETLPNSFMAGDRNVTRNNARLLRGVNVISDAAQLGWDARIHTNQGNLCMGDGSVQQTSSARLREAFRNSGVTNMTFSIP